MLKVIFGVMLGLLIIVILAHYSYKKAHKDFEDRQERYKRMI